MLILVVYDIETVTVEGRTRLRRVAKACEAVGRRIQNSVFECMLDASQFRSLQAQLKAIINPGTDQVRYYNLGTSYEGRITDHRPQRRISCETPLIL